MAKFVTIGERLSTTAPAVNKAFTERDPEPILKRAKQQLDAGATYLDVNIGPAENDGPELMKWAVELLQGNFDNVPLALDTSNVAAIEAGISVWSMVWTLRTTCGLTRYSWLSKECRTNRWKFLNSSK